MAVIKPPLMVCLLLGALLALGGGLDDPSRSLASSADCDAVVAAPGLLAGAAAVPYCAGPVSMLLTVLAVNSISAGIVPRRVPLAMICPIGATSHS